MRRFLESRRKVTLAGLGLVVITAILVYPFESTTVPERKIRALDEAGNAAEGVLVRQHWQNYSVESSGHEQDLITDFNGYVSFPARLVRASLIQRTIRSIVNLGAFSHASYGPNARVVAWGESTQGSVSYEPGKPLPEYITLRNAK
jgi:hypothetical protein